MATGTGSAGVTPDDTSTPGVRRLPVAGSRVPTPFPGSLPLPATGREVAQFVAMRAAACVGADYSNLALLDSAGNSLRLFHGTFLDPELADRFSDVALDAPYPIAAAVREERRGPASESGLL